MLTIGLFAAGVGTMVFLRNAQVNAIDAQLRQLAPTDIVSSLMRVSVDEGELEVEPDELAPSTQYVIAIYGPDGELIETAGGNSDTMPAFPDTFTLDKTLTRGTEPFPLASVDGRSTFHASVDFLAPIDGVRDSYTQMVALPLAPANQTVANYIGIYTFLAFMTVLAGALLTRGLVTLAFRSLGEVEDTAMSIAAGNLSQRMGQIAPGTEVGKLKIALNAMLDRVDRAIAQRDSSVQQMRRFIGDASHELRTPLVTVRGYAELYRMGAIRGDENISQSMERIEKEAIRMGVLVEDLLALARLDERRDIVVTDVDLRPIARDAALDARAAAPDRTVTFVEAARTPTEAIELTLGTTHLPGGKPRRSPRSPRALLRRRRTADTAATPVVAPAAGAADAGARPPGLEHGEAPQPIVLGDENRIRQVVANLLGNARRYTPDGSPIELAVGVDEAAGMGWIAVIDHGDGVPPQIRDKIFQRFWRADTSRTRETGGSGLGLSIVASVVEALHGAIDVTDTTGGGATFRAAFPLAKARDAAEHLSIETQPLPRMRSQATEQDESSSTASE